LLSRQDTRNFPSRNRNVQTVASTIDFKSLERLNRFGQQQKNCKDDGERERVKKRKKREIQEKKNDMKNVTLTSCIDEFHGITKKGIRKEAIKSE
jgi:hypothetical protein